MSNPTQVGGLSERKQSRLDEVGHGLAMAGISVLIVSLPWGPVAVQWIQLLACLSLIGGVLLVAAAGNRRVAIDRCLLGATIVFMISFALSIAWSRSPERSLDRSLGMPIAMLCGIVAFMASRNARSLRVVSVASVAALVLLAIDIAFQRWGDFSLLSGTRWSPRLQGSLPNPNDVAMAVPLAALVMVGVPRPQWVAWLSWLLCLAILAWLQWSSGSRNIILGGWVVAAVLIASGYLRVASRARWLLWAAMLLIVFVAAIASPRHREAIVSIWSGETPPFDSASSDPSGRMRHPQALVERAATAVGSLVKESHRPQLFAVAVNGFLDHPWSGCGPGLFAEAWWYYEGGVDWGEVAPTIGYMPWAHNLHLEAAAERGAIGLGAWLLLMGCVIGKGIRGLSRRDELRSNREAIACGLAALASMLVMGIFDLTLLKEWVSMLLAISLGLVAGGTAKSGDSLANDQQQTRKTRQP